MVNNEKAYNLFRTLQEESGRVNLSKGCGASVNEKFVYATLQLCNMNLENPFENDEDAAMAYDDMIYFYRLTDPKKQDCAFRTRCARAALDVVMLADSNPFCKDNVVEEVSYEELKETVSDAAEAEDLMSGTYVPVDPPKKIFGVPGKKKRWRDR